MANSTEKKVLYISGKITGTDDYVERFEKAEQDAKKLFPDALIVNPVKLCSNLPVESTWSQYMKVCLNAIKDCTHIMMLPGWQDSHGACIESMIAEERGMVFV